MSRERVPRYYTGQWIAENKKIEPFQLFDLLKAGVRAVTHDGLKVVDRDPLLRKEFTLEELQAEEWRLEELARGTDSTGIVITGRSCGSRQEPRKQLSRIETDKNVLCKFEKLPKDKWTDPKGCKSISFTLPDDDIGRMTVILEAKTFRYVSADTDKYFDNEDNQNHPLLSEETQNEAAGPAPAASTASVAAISPADYIMRRREKGVNIEIIAFELHDETGNFKLSYLAICRSLGLAKDLQPNQVDAMKQRARRACINGKALSQK